LAAQTVPAAAVPAAAAKAVPRSFHGISLGMSLDQLRAALAASDLFSFRGDRDVSLLPLSNQVLIETTGLSFVKRAFFQLEAGRLYLMAFNLDPDKIDHYSVYAALAKDYGEPAELDPRLAVWSSPETRLSLERPLTVKYLDRAVFEALVRDAAAGQADAAVLREEFLNAF
jgi:hypothetical protein